MTTTVRIADFLSSSRRYVAKAVQQANGDGSSTLTAREAQALPKDLRDNFAKLGQTRVGTARFVDTVVDSFAAAARAADKNRDGKLSATEAKRLPAEVRDNLTAYVHARSNAGTVKDETPASRVRAHEAQYESRVSYRAAFEKAARAVLTDDSPESPRGLLLEQAEYDGVTLSRAQLDAQLKKALEGLELLAPGETGESMAESDTHWIFAVGIDVGTDHGFWACVDRQTGETYVTGFN